MRSPRHLVRLLGGLWLLAVTYMPGDYGARLRAWYYGSRLKHLGEGVRLDVGVQIEGAEWISIGDHTWIDKFVVLVAGPPGIGERKVARKDNPSFAGVEGEVRIGRNCHIAPFCVLVGHGGISIADHCGIGSGGKVYSFSHHYRNPLDPDDAFPYRYTPFAPEAEQALYLGPAVMEEYSGLAVNSIMLPGSTIGRNSWVLVDSVVLGAVPPNAIAAGNPASPVKSRREA